MLCCVVSLSLLLAQDYIAELADAEVERGVGIDQDGLEASALARQADRGALAAPPTLLQCSSLPEALLEIVLQMQREGSVLLACWSP